MKRYKYYDQLEKPRWAPPPWVFGPVWTILYIIIFLSYADVLVLYADEIIPFAILLPFILNLVFNFLFTPIQFRLKSNFLASIDILLVLGTLVWALIAIYQFKPILALVNIPYLLWVCFATALQLKITYLNRK